GQKVNGAGKYSIEAAWNEFWKEFPNNIINRAHFGKALQLCVTKFNKKYISYYIIYVCIMKLMIPHVECSLS
ncbi:hypothetical protein, partial [Enterobacter cloacae complex sp. 2DZ2F20B]|uniref:hypothetical protein n=1 Tax=Enterobacter cloacae complex sp. 2DZ2F20B TaxID=2511993 RepID=UPI001CA521CB